MIQKLLYKAFLKQGRVLSVCACLSLSSAGVGRTGVFITLSIVLERMRYEGVVDIFQTVKMLRTQRPAMVQTEVKRYDVLLVQNAVDRDTNPAAPGE